MTYLIVVEDHRDEDAPARRAAVRQAHLDGIRPHAEAGRVQVGGALLDEDGTMRGSMLVIAADDANQVRALLQDDVYAREGVWDLSTVTIRPFRRAV